MKRLIIAILFLMPGFLMSTPSAVLHTPYNPCNGVASVLIDGITGVAPFTLLDTTLHVTTQITGNSITYNPAPGKCNLRIIEANGGYLDLPQFETVDKNLKLTIDDHNICYEEPTGLALCTPSLVSPLDTLGDAPIIEWDRGTADSIVATTAMLAPGSHTARYSINGCFIDETFKVLSLSDFSNKYIKINKGCDGSGGSIEFLDLNEENDRSTFYYTWVLIDVEMLQNLKRGAYKMTNLAVGRYRITVRTSNRDCIGFTIELDIEQEIPFTMFAPIITRGCKSSNTPGKVKIKVSPLSGQAKLPYKLYDWQGNELTNITFVPSTDNSGNYETEFDLQEGGPFCFEVGDASGCPNQTFCVTMPIQKKINFGISVTSVLQNGCKSQASINPQQLADAITNGDAIPPLKIKWGNGPEVEWNLASPLQPTPVDILATPASHRCEITDASGCSTVHWYFNGICGGVINVTANPNTGLYVEVCQGVIEAGEVNTTFRDINGIVVLEINHGYRPGGITETYTINIQSLPVGNYYIQGTHNGSPIGQSVLFNKSL